MDTFNNLSPGIDVSSGDVEISLMDVGKNGDRLYFTGVDLNTDKSIAFITQSPDYASITGGTASKEGSLQNWLKNPENRATIAEQVTQAMQEIGLPADQRQNPAASVVFLKEEWGISNDIIAEVDPQANIVSAPESEPLHIDNPDDLLTNEVELGTLGR